MSNITVFSDIFRMSFCNLSKPYKGTDADSEPKYGIKMLFPQSGVLPVNGQPTSTASIQQALDKACMEEWGIPFEQAKLGIQYPPTIKNGDSEFLKDTNNNPIPNSVNPITQGMYTLTAKNADQPGCCDPSGNVEIAPKDICPGYWCRAELEVAAFEVNKARIVALKLINVQLCYKDEIIAGRAPAKAATESFKGMAITDTNVQGMMPAVQQTGNPPMHTPPVNNVHAVPQQTPQVPAAYEPPPQVVQTPGTIQNNPIVDPASLAPPPLNPPPQQAPQVPVNNDPVIMNQGEGTFAERVAQGWNADTLVQHNKAVYNYTNPAQ